MSKKDIKSRLENLAVPEAADPADQKIIKLAILSARSSAQTSVWLLAVPAVILLGAMFDSLLHISLPPWSWIKDNGQYWPLWLRVTLFTTVVMVFPVIAVLLNVLSIIWFSYDRAQKVLNISIKLKTVNLVIIIIAGVLAALFIGHAIADTIAGHN
jgi:hypothetical protein